MRIILPFLAVAWAIPHPITLEEEWNQYKESFGKFYTSEEEDIKRLNAYLATKEKVDKHNGKYERGETSFTMTINEFADWFPEELSKMNGLKVDENDLSKERTVLELPSGVKVPDEIDWVKKGAVTSVKNQGNCGSCYAFSAVGALEGLMFITNKTITSLSAQELVDCSTVNDNSGCDGGFMTSCFSYVIHRKGISTDKSYPYVAREEKCKADKGQIGADCSSYVTLKQTEDALKEAVGTISPVSIGFAVNNEFFGYKEGIYDGECDRIINHGMLAVGYGTDSKTGIHYWLVKNSWGEKWGINGYVKILRGVNKCNINLLNSYPVYK